MTAEEDVRTAFEGGAPKRLADLGGADFFRGRGDELARTVFMPELLSLALAEIVSKPIDDAVENFVLACAGVPVGPNTARASDYKDAIEALAAAALPEDLAERCQEVLVGRITRWSDNEVARWVALGAALQIALTHPDLRHGLVGALVRLKVEGNPPEFLRRAAKVIGVALSHWPDSSLTRALDRLSQDAGARDEALFELGMAALRDGLDAEAPNEVDRCFEAAREHFVLSVAARESRPDARSYSTALLMLTALRRGDSSDDLCQYVKTIQREVTIARAWSQPVKAAWGWMGAYWTELVRWQELAMEIAALDATAEAAAQASTEVAIRNRLLGAYIANRSVLSRGAGGVEVFVRPHIEARLLREEVEREVTFSWLAEEEASPSSPWRVAAAELLAEMRTRGVPAGKPMGGGPLGLTAAAPLGHRTTATNTCLDEAQRVARNAISAMAEGLSPQAERIITKVVELLAAHPDYAATEAQLAVDAVLWNLVRFLDYRMDMTRGHDPTGNYLFSDTERVAAPSPAGASEAVAKKSCDSRDQFERALQLDCIHVIQPALGRSAHLEVSDIAAGRADILVELNRTRLVIEVKREDTNASHDALLRKYGSQATEYSNTSARIGFLLVLDRSRTDGSAGHIEEKVAVRTVRKPADTEDRMLVIVVMPGRRKRPSSIT